MSDYDNMCNINNLKRAYRWLNSNPEATYKNLFRDLFSNYALSSKSNLEYLQKELKQHRYEARSASKLFRPKVSGTLRPITILTVEDQIVYQACVNIIAEKLIKKTRRRYHKSVFQHLYAGKSSKFFYRKWQTSYRLYNNSILKSAHKCKYYADFDLASFYDTIDHNVLRFFLNDLKISHDLVEFLLQILKVWTSITWPASSNYIVHGHGIPQGPLPSGMLAECVLQHIDIAGTRTRYVHYYRYVDDIKLLAEKYESLSKRIVTLDLACKEIALFPQTSKLSIGEINDPNDLIKSPSIPIEPCIVPAVNQKAVQKRLVELSKGYSLNKGTETTKFKFILAKAKTSYKLNNRLMRIMINQPELSFSIASYFSRYNSLPKKVAGQILDYLNSQELYHAVHADLLNAVLDNMNKVYTSSYIDYCKNRLNKTSGKLPLQPSFKLALVKWLMKHKSISYSEYEQLFENEVDWWLKSHYLVLLQEDDFGRPTYQSFLNVALKSHVPEISRTAAVKLINDKIGLKTRVREIDYSGQIPLAVTRKIKRKGTPRSLIPSVLRHVFSRSGKLPSFDWRKFLGRKHKHAESMIIHMKQSYETDIDAFVVRFDSFCDYLFEHAWGTINPSKKYGNYGSMLSNPTMQSQIPKTCDSFTQLHKLRIKSVTSHPRHTKTRTPNKRIKHGQFFKIRKQLFGAYVELISYFV